MNGITKQTFQEADEKTRLDILFDYQKDTHAYIQEIKLLLQQHPTNCEERFKAIEGSKVKDTLLSGAMGFIGGFTAIVAKLNIWK
jgi:hypothetical protein